MVVEKSKDFLNYRGGGLVHFMDKEQSKKILLLAHERYFDAKN